MFVVRAPLPAPATSAILCTAMLLTPVGMGAAVLPARQKFDFWAPCGAPHALICVHVGCGMVVKRPPNPGGPPTHWARPGHVAAHTAAAPGPCRFLIQLSPGGGHGPAARGVPYGHPRSTCSSEGPGRLESIYCRSTTRRRGLAPTVG